MAVSTVKIEKISQDVPLNPGTEEVPESDNSFSNQILILFSAPLLDENLLPVENLSIQKEIEAIALVLNEISHPISVEIVVKVATSVTLQDVFSNRNKPLIIHFIGHGTREGDNTALVLEDEVGMTRSFSEEELEIALSNQKQAPCQVALLNACHSEKLAQAFINIGVPHVIAVNAEDKILDMAARCFSRRLYQALFNQDSVVDSFLSGRNAVKLDDKLKKQFNSKTFKQGVNFDEAFKFKLLPQDPHSESLIIEPTNAHQVTYSQWSNTNIPRENPDFVGRRLEIHQILKVLVESDKRCLALHGMGGIGKTALAEAIGCWLHERERYHDGVWFIGLRDADSVGTLITQIMQIFELRDDELIKELRKKRIFLILDDLDNLIKSDLDELIDFLNFLLGQCPNLKLLLTSCNSLVRDLLYCHQEEVQSMGASETREIFRKYAPSETKWGEDDDLAEDFNRLVQFLDGYPLAIKLAASYMQETNYSLHRLCKALDLKPLRVLHSDSSQEKKERSLRITLELSFRRLSVQAQDLFSFLTFFPSGLSMDVAEAIWKEDGEEALQQLFKFSMAEKSPTASDWRVTLPEPARNYAESKLQKGRGIEYLAPQVLDYYQSSFCNKVLGEAKKTQQLLLQENSNLILFLEWGYEQEKSFDRICRSARITASLSSYWHWIEPNQDPLSRLNLALTAAQRNQDREGESLVRNLITAFSTKEEFKDVQTLVRDSDNANYFQFEVVTVNDRGEEIKREQKEAEYKIEDLGNGVNLEMVYIPGGTFMMGSPEGEGYDDEKPQHKVTIQSFLMGKYSITQAQYRQIMGKNPSYFKGDDKPVENISWEDAVEFCQRLSKQTGREYRLPTEAEWEYAARAGTITPFHFGETITSDLANYNGNSTYASEPKGEYRGKTISVGNFTPNAFGLYDMHGNVWEWCQDDWHNSYDNAPTNVQVWVSEDSSAKVIRGGSWGLDPSGCRSAFRCLYSRGDRFDYIGFRVVCVAPRTT